MAASSCARAMLFFTVLGGAAASRTYSPHGLHGEAGEAGVHDRGRWPGERGGALMERKEELQAEVAQHMLHFLAFPYDAIAGGRECPSVILWNRGGLLRTLHFRQGCNIARLRPLPPGDRVLAWGCGAPVTIWSTATGQVLQELDMPGLQSADLLSGDRVVATAGGVGGIWDASSGVMLREFRRPEMEVVIAFADGCRLLLWGGDSSTATLLDAGTGQPLCVLRGHSFRIGAVAIFADGGRLVTGSRDHTAIVWSVAACAAQHVLTHRHGVEGVAALESVERVATLSSHGRVEVWNAATGEMMSRLVELGYWWEDIFEGVLAFPHEGRLVAFGLHGAVIWDAASGTRLHRLGNRTSGAAVSPSGDVLALCGGGRASVWDTTTGEILGEVEVGVADAGRGSCSVSLVPGRALDPRGFGRGLPWSDMTRGAARPLAG